MTYIKMLGIVLCLITFVHCKDDMEPMPDCMEYELKLGPFSLDESSRDLFPYSPHDSILVFKDEANNELFFHMTFFIKDTFPHIASILCPFDSTVLVPYYSENEVIQVNFTNDSLNISVNFIFNAAYRREMEMVTSQSDLAGFHLTSQHLDVNAHVTSVIVHKSGQTPLVLNNYFDSLELGSKTFNAVYSNYPLPQQPSNIKIYMNHEMGILGFEESVDGPLWVFDRFE